MAGRLPAGGFGQSAGAAVLVDDPGMTTIDEEEK
jgi:hypothetical protein